MAGRHVHPQSRQHADDLIGGRVERRVGTHRGVRRRRRAAAAAAALLVALVVPAAAVSTAGAHDLRAARRLRRCVDQKWGAGGPRARVTRAEQHAAAAAVAAAAGGVLVVHEVQSVAHSAATVAVRRQRAHVVRVSDHDLVNRAAIASRVLLVVGRVAGMQHGVLHSVQHLVGVVQAAARRRVRRRGTRTAAATYRRSSIRRCAAAVPRMVRPHVLLVKGLGVLMLRDPVKVLQRGSRRPAVAAAVAAVVVVRVSWRRRGGGAVCLGRQQGMLWRVAMRRGYVGRGPDRAWECL
eukprot:160041-Chlamydomonas_euryale.AAC.11